MSEPPREDRETAFERKAWIVAYGVIFVVLAAGAARRIWGLL